MSRPAGRGDPRSVGVPSVGARPRKSSLAPKPRKTITTQQRRKSTGSSVPTMDRNTMMLMEANEISAYLQKEYEFSKKQNGTDEMSVKVLNTKLNISCTWSFSKFKERLNKMRKLMYKDDNDTLGGDAVFFDPNDTWEREDPLEADPVDLNANGPAISCVTSIPAPQTQIKLHSAVPDVIDVTNIKNKSVAERPLSPQGANSSYRLNIKHEASNGNNRTLGSTQGSASELPADSEFILNPPSPDILTNGIHSEKCGDEEETRRISAVKQAIKPRIVGQRTQAVQRNGSPEQSGELPTASECQNCNVLEVCTNMAERLSAALNGKAVESDITMIDKILSNCESIKISVINLLSAYTAESNKAKRCHSVSPSSIHLVSSLELLVSHTTYFLSSFETTQSTVLNGLRNTITELVKSMTCHITTILKGCNEHEDDLVHDSASDLIECLFEVVKLCGELSLATETLPVFLQQDGGRELTSFTSEQQTDVLRPKCSIEIRQSLLSGCDSYVECAIRESLKSVRNCEASVELYLQETHITQQGHEEILKHTEIIIATTKILILKFQEIQTEVSTQCKDESEEKPSNYFEDYFERCQLILSTMSNLSGSVSLLTQAGETAISEPEVGNLRKVSRCAEMVSRATLRLLGQDVDSRSPTYEPNSSTMSDSPSVDTKSRSPELRAVLSVIQIEELDKAGSDVKLAVQSLLQTVKRSLADQPGSGKVRRMLPVTPVTGKGLMRAHSARARSATDRDRVSRRLSMIDTSKSQDF